MENNAGTALRWLQGLRRRILIRPVIILHALCLLRISMLMRILTRVPIPTRVRRRALVVGLVVEVDMHGKTGRTITTHIRIVTHTHMQAKAHTCTCTASTYTSTNTNTHTVTHATPCLVLKTQTSTHDDGQTHDRSHQAYTEMHADTRTYRSAA